MRHPHGQQFRGRQGATCYVQSGSRSGIDRWECSRASFARGSKSGVAKSGRDLHRDGGSEEQLLQDRAARCVGDHGFQRPGPDEDGSGLGSRTINFPLAGEIEAGGKTAREVEQALTKRLGTKYLQNPQITVFVKEHNSQRITVEGAVKKPGVVPMAGGVSLLQAIAQSGGLDEVAESTAVVFRMANGKRLAAKYDIANIRAGRAEDPQLQSGDVVIVPTSDVKEGINMVVKFLPLAYLIPYL